MKVGRGRAATHRSPAKAGASEGGAGKSKKLEALSDPLTVRPAIPPTRGASRTAAAIPARAGLDARRLPAPLRGVWILAASLFEHRHHT